MGQVRDNLPNGNPRNKIEYLADLLDSMETGGTVINLLANGEINLNTQTSPNPPLITVDTKQAIDPNTTIEFGRNAVSGIYGWGLEVGTAQNNTGYIKHETSEKSKYQHPSIPVTNGVLSCSTNGDGVAYSVFTAPQGGKAHNALKARVLVGASSDANITVGIARVELNENTGELSISNLQDNPYRRVATQGKAEHYLTPTWIETPELICQFDGGSGLYVVYVHVTNDTAFMVYGAEAWHASAGNVSAGETVTLPNATAMTGYHNYTRMLKSTNAEYVSGLRYKWKFSRHYHFAFHPKHHLTLWHGISYQNGFSANIVEYGSNFVVIEYSQAMFDWLTDHQTLSVAYSAIPVCINFYG
ncbi:hypothetical protein LIA61_002765 [Vibrio parahaemolyticus]|uniref:hypothetical protein n=1 Tax=Vibrio parahaemolyticus TaxID=670 RepID=UPI00186A8027|nr:hypothetical protein [Vibrio parahaemolyticus]EIJ2224285.1 hypothetical protein [Vibrio parahaemolyticus]EJG1840581.1 hypothetical protein [Vibrio parahaemolyticus]EJM7846917.1 hypothetical protein [Vibrio parahaemolyticus]MBE4163361.1 hypothetical protein [Vibrio parahaemolyticus]